ncbi:arylesterase [Patiriisocius marinistellae]|uniref:Arylesterase n=1 Tax=Patiriisocius marinistellae TaxID=2494560 RepID=A0A5J4FUN2_9FLAO|nr:alpha/beta hydrolase [Patiriisocius marinistellae]GEQ84868.1 arylesterase [Patiriisocius marinistellae]
MPYIETSSKEKERNIKLYYEDYGEGKPVILIHGWPLSSAMWEQQKWAIVEAGYRCISYDRRGFGKSDFPWQGYDYDTLSQDLNDLIQSLKLKDVTLVGFSMGGGELGRYVGKFGTDKLSKLVFLSSIAPFMMKTDDNPDGVPESVFEGFKDSLETDRVDFLKGFGKNFVNYEDNKDKISESLLHYTWNIAANASPKGTIDCVNAFGKTDLRNDLKKIDVPTLFIHGDADEVVPVKPTSEQGHKIVNNSKLHIIKGAPHGCVFTHKEEVNKTLLDFLKA